MFLDEGVYEHNEGVTAVRIELGVVDVVRNVAESVVGVIGHVSPCITVDEERERWEGICKSG